MPNLFPVWFSNWKLIIIAHIISVEIDLLDYILTSFKFLNIILEYNINNRFKYKINKIFLYKISFILEYNINNIY